MVRVEGDLAGLCYERQGIHEHHQGTFVRYQHNNARSEVYGDLLVYGYRLDQDGLLQN